LKFSPFSAARPAVIACVLLGEGIRDPVFGGIYVGCGLLGVGKIAVET